MVWYWFELLCVGSNVRGIMLSIGLRITIGGSRKVRVINKKG